MDDNMICDCCEEVAKCGACKMPFDEGEYVICVEHGGKGHHYHYHNDCTYQGEIRNEE